MEIEEMIDKEILDESKLEKMIEKIQRQAFLEGYQYAIQILEEGLVKEKK